MERERLLTRCHYQPEPPVDEDGVMRLPRPPREFRLKVTLDEFMNSFNTAAAAAAADDDNRHTGGFQKILELLPSVQELDPPGDTEDAPLIWLLDCESQENDGQLMLTRTVDGGRRVAYYGYHGSRFVDDYEGDPDAGNTLLDLFIYGIDTIRIEVPIGRDDDGKWILVGLAVHSIPGTVMVCYDDLSSYLEDPDTYNNRDAQASLARHETMAKVCQWLTRLAVSYCCSSSVTASSDLSRIRLQGDRIPDPHASRLLRGCLDAVRAYPCRIPELEVSQFNMDPHACQALADAVENVDKLIFCYCENLSRFLNERGPRELDTDIYPDEVEADLLALGDAIATNTSIRKLTLDTRIHDAHGVHCDNIPRLIANGANIKILHLTAFMSQNTLEKIHDLCNEAQHLEELHLRIDCYTGPLPGFAAACRLLRDIPILRSVKFHQSYTTRSDWGAEWARVVADLVLHHRSVSDVTIEGDRQWLRDNAAHVDHFNEVVQPLLTVNPAKENLKELQRDASHEVYKKVFNELLECTIRDVERSPCKRNLELLHFLLDKQLDQTTPLPAGGENPVQAIENQEEPNVEE